MSDTTRLAGKVALVTGGSRGIGAAIARRLAAEGAAVALTFQSNAAGAEAVALAIREAGGRALALRADAGDAAAAAGAVERTVAEFGRIDILVNNAGIARFAPVADMTLDDFDASFAVNVRAVWAAAKAAAAHMGEGGRIVTIGSVNADRMPVPGGAAYAMSKAAVAGLTRGLARDLGPRGITVNVVQPGPVDTDMNPADGPFAPTLLSLMAVKRYAEGDEIAGLVAYLAGPEAGFVTGAALTIDGGFAA
ncbi:MAG TPA: 3-oxoacyl-ACP reductase family protein [Alphaproteobacteria bacterium]|nr:3-oxoacyl-ACP reductase family protein [Alphaproteobacteria bacterium]